MNWIACKDRMPREFESVIISVNDRIAIAWWASFGTVVGKRIRWYFDTTDESCDAEEITHWMPFPEPPKP